MIEAGTLQSFVFLFIITFAILVKFGYFFVINSV